MFLRRALYKYDIKLCAVQIKRLNRAEKQMKSIIPTLLFWLVSPAYAENQAGKGVGYKSVDAALSALKARSDITFTTTQPDSWLIATDEKNVVIWSFTPQGHYAYPAVVKRAVMQNTQGQVYIETSALCQANKTSCDRLMNEFAELTEQIREDVRQKIGQ